MSEMTFYATSSDGWQYPNGSSPYSTAHDASAADTQRTTDNYISIENDWYAPLYYVVRAYLYFDTSDLPDGAVISAVDCGLYGSSVYNANGYLETNSGHPDIGIVQGVQQDPFALSDFGAELGYTTLGHDSYFDVSAGWTVNGYNTISFNATGISWINKTGITKLCVKCKGDNTNTAPTGNNYTQFYANEKGSGYKPRLVITYTAGETKTSADSGAGTESTVERQIGIIEQGMGAEEGLAAAVVISGDEGSGSETGGLLQDLFSQDEGSGADKFKILAGKAGSDLRLHSHQGKVGIPHKEVSL